MNPERHSCVRVCAPNPGAAAGLRSGFVHSYLSKTPSTHLLPLLQGFNDIQIQQTAAIVDDTVERDQEVVKIIESVNELAQIMKDLAVLVIDQGTILDRIDYNIQQVAAHVEDGVVQIKKADETQKSNKMLIIITCLGGAPPRRHPPRGPLPPLGSVFR